MTKQYAEEYFRTHLENKPKPTKVHVDFLSVNNTVTWQRSDSRVSKEQFECKIEFSKATISVVHQPPDSELKCKLSFAFQSVMGMRITSDSIEADIIPKPVTEIKSSASQPQGSRANVCAAKFVPYNEPQIGEATSYNTIIRLNTRSRDAFTKLKDQILLVPCLRRAADSGIQQHYDSFDPCEENPHELYPLVRDPTLVRAAQLAILQLQSESDLHLVIRMYDGIKKRFQQLLQQRLSNHRRHEVDAADLMQLI